MTSLRGLIILYWLLILIAAAYLRTAIYDDVFMLLFSSFSDVALLLVQSVLLYKIIGKDQLIVSFLQVIYFFSITIAFCLVRYWLEGLFYGFGLTFQGEVAVKFLFTKFMTSLIISGVTIAYLIWLRLNYVKEQKLKTEIEKKQMEIEFLKSRVNPHFLFNSLGSIHSLATIRSEKTPLLIEKLSNLMRYTFYDCQQPTVAIKKEVNFIQDFIDFHQIKSKDKLNVTFDHCLDNGGLYIEPLLFISTVENAYKHGNIFSGGYIKISFWSNKGILRFECVNSGASDQRNDPNHTQSGFGVKNLEQRLSTHYPNQHKILINQDNDVYSVKIEIYKYEEI